MSWDLQLASRAERVLRRLSERDRVRISRVLNEMKNDPFAGTSLP
jgi:hypothetical protein